MFESQIALVVPAALAILAIDVLQRVYGRDLFFTSWRPALRGVVLTLLLVPIIIFSGGQPTPFIYFQF